MLLVGVARASLCHPKLFVIERFGGWVAVPETWRKGETEGGREGKMRWRCW